MKQPRVLKFFLVHVIMGVPLIAWGASPLESIAQKFYPHQCGIYTGTGYFELNKTGQFIFTLNKGTPFALEFISYDFAPSELLNFSRQVVEVSFYLPQEKNLPNQRNGVFLKSIRSSTKLDSSFELKKRMPCGVK